jgi:urea transporter
MKNLAPTLSKFFREITKGFAQIMLQPSVFVGAAFIIGAFVNSWQLALFGLAGCCAGVVIAMSGQFPADERADGLYGFNGGLVGLGLGYFYGFSWQILLLVVIGGMASSLVMHWMLRRDFRPLTFPFVVTAWSVIILLSLTSWVAPVSSELPGSERVELLEAVSRGYGQVLFQESVITGLIFVAAIAVRNWVEGLYATLGTAFGLLCAYVAGLPADDISLGLFGYNGVLCGILFAGRTIRDFVSAIAAIALSVVVVRIFHVVGAYALTFPFVLSSWMVLWMRGRIFPALP